MAEEDNSRDDRVVTLLNFLLEYKPRIGRNLKFVHNEREIVICQIEIGYYGSMVWMVYIQTHLRDGLDQFMSEDTFLGVFPETNQCLIQTNEIPGQQSFIIQQSRRYNYQDV